MIGHWLAGVQNRELGWAQVSPVQTKIFHDCRVNVKCEEKFKKSPEHAELPFPGVHLLFVHEVSVTPGASGSSMPSQYIPPSLVSATLVKMVFLCMVFMALGFVFTDVPGATPKNPFSGLIALKLPGI